MFFGSTKCRRRLYHTDNCRHTQSILAKNRILFHTAGEAAEAGYIPCLRCGWLGNALRKERGAVDAFCRRNNFSRFVHNGELFVIAAKDIAWRICPPKQTGSYPILMHESIFDVPYIREQKPYPERQYHRQKAYCSTLLGYLEYILDHDRFAAEREQKRKLEKALARERQRSVRAVLKQLSRHCKRRGKKHSCNSRQSRCFADALPV